MVKPSRGDGSRSRTGVNRELATRQDCELIWSAATCRRFPFQIGVISSDKRIESHSDDKSSHSKSRNHSHGVSGLRGNDFGV